MSLTCHVYTRTTHPYPIKLYINIILYYNIICRSFKLYRVIWILERYVTRIDLALNCPFVQHMCSCCQLSQPKTLLYVWGTRYLGYPYMCTGPDLFLFEHGVSFKVYMKRMHLFSNNNLDWYMYWYTSNKIKIINILYYFKYKE